MKQILLSMGQIVQHQAINNEALDAHGNPSPSYTDPTPVRVYGVAPRTAEESTGAGQDYTTEATWDIYAPVDTPIKAFDRLTLPTGQQVEVTAPPKIWQNAPLLNYLDVQGAHIIATELK